MSLGAVLRLVLMILIAGTCGDARAQDDDAEGAARRIEQPGRTGLPLPRFVSLRAVEVNLRTGPGIRYPIDWVYQRRGLPVEVIDEFETWRRIRDHEGTTGWVHRSMLDGRRGVLVIGEITLLRRAPDPAAPGVARMEPGLVGRLESCEEQWCRVTVAGYTGWLQRASVFGVYPSEIVP